MAIPYPPPDPVELAEYLAQYLRREIKAGKFTQADLHRRSAAWSRSRQCSRSAGKRCLALLLMCSGKQRRQGDFCRWISACRGTRQLGPRRATTPVTKASSAPYKVA